MNCIGFWKELLRQKVEEARRLSGEGSGNGVVQFEGSRVPHSAMQEQSREAVCKEKDWAFEASYQEKPPGQVAYSRENVQVVRT